MAFFDKILDKIGVSEVELDDEYTEDEYDFEEENNSNVSAFSRNTARKRPTGRTWSAFPRLRSRRWLFTVPYALRIHAA